MIYIFGDASRIAGYGVAADYAVETLSWRNLFSMGEDDVLLVARVWSPLVAFLFLRKKRPLVLQFADGLVTESNCTKVKNRKPYFLYERVFADKFYVRQPMESLPNFISRENTGSIVDHALEYRKFQFNCLILVFGNDPIVGTTMAGIFEDIERIISVAKGIPVYMTSGDERFASKVCGSFGQIKSLGLMRDNVFLDDAPLFISTPSTVAYDLLLKNQSVMIFPSVSCATLSRLFSRFDCSALSSVKGRRFVELKKAADIKNYQVDIASCIKRRTDCPRYSLRMFFLQLRGLLGDLMWLFKG